MSKIKQSYLRATTSVPPSGDTKAKAVWQQAHLQHTSYSCLPCINDFVIMCPTLTTSQDTQTHSQICCLKILISLGLTSSLNLCCSFHSTIDHKFAPQAGKLCWPWCQSCSKSSPRGSHSWSYQMHHYCLENLAWIYKWTGPWPHSLNPWGPSTFSTSLCHTNSMWRFISLLFPTSATMQIDQMLFYLIYDYKELIDGWEKND